ncbi:hypothetical protein ACMYSQ_008399 [Aspergillus niger]
MCAGPCTEVLKVGELECHCSCRQGIFQISFQEGKGRSLLPLNSKIREAHEELEAIIPPTRCLRKETVLKVVDVLASENVVLVRGTPASGKTTLCELLRDYYLGKNQPVFLISFWNKPLETFAGGDHWFKFARLLHEKFPDYTEKEFFSPGTIILIDEAQSSYGDFFLWNKIIKEGRDESGLPIKICLFCSYGSPDTGLEGESVDYCPVTFGIPQRITLTPQDEPLSTQVGLFYTAAEFAEAVWLRTTLGYMEKFTIDNEAISYLYEFTDGHPGVLVALVNYILSVHRHDLERRLISKITKEILLDDLKDDDSVCRYIENESVSRSFPSGITPEIESVLSTILEEGSMRFDMDDESIRECYQSGWVHRMSQKSYGNDDILVLSSRLHEK